jgi:hypothetical protein
MAYRHHLRKQVKNQMRNHLAMKRRKPMILNNHCMMKKRRTQKLLLVDGDAAILLLQQISSRCELRAANCT